MKNLFVSMKSAAQMKFNPSFSPHEVGFHHEVISSTAGGFIPSARTDLVEKKQPLSTGQRLFLFWSWKRDSNTRPAHYEY